MSLVYGYEIEGDTAGGNGRIVVPPLLKDKITVSTSSNTNKWVFIGSRAEILHWIRQHSNLILENAIFSGGDRPSFHTHNEVVIDLLNYSDPEQSFFQYVRSYVKTDNNIDKVKVEIRPKVESKDQNIMTACRIIVNSGVSLASIVDNLEEKWNAPGASYVQQAVDLFNEVPGPQHVLSSDVPVGVQTESRQPTI
ncbi:hypothetical protein K450DRAFT_239283 [Umbelopsis ramanniana AG]|uniref:Uncharacterized protein n=1 Tax=Umbelopsis ramanniana AG TaxID=1314678 RepID=A0AAD5HEH5_UMBRA|nr:uncharacterized protein K450DRAFT_239283 [Umbelopsis ramanniana AG]KAI8580079.1 hypothetical protein K450DRAFT_239283 [Umbelopsis ramanniana AG]